MSCESERLQSPDMKTENMLTPTSAELVMAAISSSSAGSWRGTAIFRA